ncbi:MAG: PqqD family peptide modification chaperone [Clostridia bacterium]|nr:PqqD family peptide modification chaperone [Clostridia bacterium]
MNSVLASKLLSARLAAGYSADITVVGISMEPLLKEGDIIRIEKASNYVIGDILVFTYKGELLVHRLIKAEKNKFFCKGDNSFRLEDIEKEGILGKVTLLNGEELPPMPEWLPALSYLINRICRKSGYSKERTVSASEYKFYHYILWKEEENTMTYKKNEALDYIPTDETSLAVFDPESGNTHFFDETGIDILNCLEDPCDLETLLNRLCEIYEATPDMIRADVVEFLAAAIANKVITVS